MNTRYPTLNKVLAAESSFSFMELELPASLAQSIEVGYENFKKYPNEGIAVCSQLGEKTVYLFNKGMGRLTLNTDPQVLVVVQALTSLGYFVQRPMAGKGDLILSEKGQKAFGV